MVVRSRRAAKGGRPEHITGVTTAVSRLWEPPSVAPRPPRIDAIDVRDLTRRAREIIDIRARHDRVVVAFAQEGGDNHVEIALSRDEARQLALELFEASGP